MGYIYGERKYGQGRYSAWPGAWHNRHCDRDEWTETVCQPEVWFDKPIRKIATPLVPFTTQRQTRWRRRA